MSVVPSRVPIPLPSERQIKRPDFLDLNNALAGITRFSAQTLNVATAAGQVSADIERNSDVKANLASRVRQAEQQVEIQQGRRDIVQSQFEGEALKRKHDELSDLQDFDADQRIATSSDAEIIDHLKKSHYLDRRVRRRLSSFSGLRAAGEDYDIGLAEKQVFRENDENNGKTFDWARFTDGRMAARGTDLPPDWAAAYRQRLLALSTGNARSEANAVTNARQEQFLGQAQDNLSESASLAVMGQEADVHLAAVHLAELYGFMDDDQNKADTVFALEKGAWLQAIYRATQSRTDTSGPVGTAESMLQRASPEVQEAIIPRVNKMLTEWQAMIDTADIKAQLAHYNRLTANATTPTELDAVLPNIEAMTPGIHRDDAMAVWKKKKDVADRTEGLIENIDATLRGDAVRTSPNSKLEKDAVNAWWLRNVTNPNANNGQPFDEKNAAIGLIGAGYPMPDAMVQKLTAAISDPIQMDVGFAADFMYGLASNTNMPTAVASMRALGDQGQMLERHVRATANMSTQKQAEFAQVLENRLKSENAPGQEDDRADAADLVWGTKDNKGKVVTNPVAVGEIMNESMQATLDQRTPPGARPPKGLELEGDRAVTEFNPEFRQELGQSIEYFYFLNRAPFANKEERLKAATRQAADQVLENWSGVFLDGQFKMIPRVFDVGPVSGATREANRRPQQPSNPSGFGNIGGSRDRNANRERRLQTETFEQRFHQHTRIGYAGSQNIFREAFGGHAQWDTRNSFESVTVPSTLGGSRHGVIVIYDSITARPKGYYVWSKEGQGQGRVYIDENAAITFQSDVVDFIPTSPEAIDAMVTQSLQRSGRTFRPNANLTRPDNLPATSIEAAHNMMAPTHDLYGEFEKAATLMFTDRERRPPSTADDQMMIDGFIEELARRHNWASVGEPVQVEESTPESTRIPVGAAQ